MNGPQRLKPRDWPAQPQDFGRLARRMADWTTKGLFSALVIVGGLGFGRQVLCWWGEDESAPAAAGPAAPAFDLAAGAGPVEIAAGNSNLWFGRETIRGDQAKATKSLRAACRQALDAAACWSPSADAEEQDLLTRLADFEPVERVSESESRLYEPAPGMPLTIGVRRFTDVGKSDSQSATESHDRVVVWGLAAPAGENAWTLYLFRALRPAAGGDAGPPLPPNCRRLMAFRNSAGAGVVAFQGTGRCDDYRRFYEAWLAEQWPQAVADWQPASGGGWHATIARGDSAAAGCAVQSLAIHLVSRQFAGCTGLVFFSP